VAEVEVSLAAPQIEFECLPDPDSAVVVAFLRWSLGTAPRTEGFALAVAGCCCFGSTGCSAAAGSG